MIGLRFLSHDGTFHQTKHNKTENRDRNEYLTSYAQYELRNICDSILSEFPTKNEEIFLRHGFAGLKPTQQLSIKIAEVSDALT